MLEKYMDEQRVVTTLLKKSIQNSFSTLLIILGIIVVFSIIINIIKYYLRVNPVILAVINSFLELTTGVKSISILNISLVYKYTLLALGLSTSGMSVIMQAFGILSGTKIDYKIFIKNKVLLVLISVFLTFIVFKNISNVTW